MKQIFTFLMVLVCIQVKAASGGPDVYGYTWKDSNEPNGPTASWWDITSIGTPVTGLADDNVVGPFALSGFQYYWYSSEKFWIGSNGYISFNPGNIASPFPNIPSIAGVNDYIAPMLSDLNFTGLNNPGQCFIYYGADSLCISWINVPFWDPGATTYTGSNSFQVILVKSSKSIIFNYLNQNGITQMNDITIGIENISGNIGLQCFKNTYPQSNYTIAFTYPPVVTFQVYDCGIKAMGNAGSTGYFAKLNDTIQLETVVRNYGNQPMSSFYVNSNVLTPLNTNVSQSFIQIGTLLAQGDTNVRFLTPLIANTIGIYRYTSYMTNAMSDMFNSNNVKQQKIIVIDTNQPSYTLDYTRGIPVGLGLSWGGGGGGVAQYFKPPVYPSRILNTGFYIQSNPNNADFQAKIYADDGPNGLPGTLLDSVLVSNTNIAVGQYNMANHISKNIAINSGGFYVMWYMAGPNIQIGRDTLCPSLNTFEILGNTWSQYRSRDLEDFLISVELDYYNPTNTPTFIENKLNVYPNPTCDIWTFNTQNPLPSRVTITDLYGKVLYNAIESNSNFSVNSSNWPAGVYFYQINQGTKYFKGKLIKY